ncbi:unnamed protein product [Caenorhabditis auriculariae]|uniref:Progestin and adipoQ receptor family member 3 n=1 Tax=Caenorhabditis auriculariae TaxID=2777116 RepID=A0A8S1HME1_9PELO|nr:unnamed protein product [Caenorhabditis auriculariae]
MAVPLYSDGLIDHIRNRFPNGSQGSARKLWAEIPTSSKKRSRLLFLYCQTHVCKRHNSYRLITRDRLHKTMWLNDYVIKHYRPTKMSPWMCICSAFHWTNETVNIWSHLLGFIYFSYLQYHTSLQVLPSIGGHFSDHLVVFLSLLGSQMCMLLSASYHTFGCTSPESRRKWLKLDIFGISAGLLGMYLSGIYTAFFCFQDHLNTYAYLLLLIFVITAYVPTRQDFFEKKVAGSRIGLLHVIYCVIITFGICPTIHWVFLHGGFGNAHVTKWIPSIFVLYGLMASAFFFYVSMVPERIWPGRFDVVGCSHQWWHLLILGAMVYWQTAGLNLLTEYRIVQDSCHRNLNPTPPSMPANLTAALRS